METTVKERLITFISSIGISKNKFETICGLGSRYVSNISVSIQPDKIKKISLNFPQLNTGWLLTGEGEMLNPDHQNENKAHNNSGVMSNISGSDNHTKIEVNASPKDFIGLLKKKDEQIDRLLTLLEKK